MPCATSGSKSDWDATLGSRKVGYDTAALTQLPLTYSFPVWPVIAVNLEFKARSNDGVGGDGREGGVGSGEA